MEPILQIALDLIDLDDAIETANEAVDTDCVDWIEVGTPLIKSEGLRAVKKIKESFPDKTIVVDMDVIGHPLELKAAIDTGADVLLISGRTSEDVIKNCVEESRKNGIETMVDITGTQSPLESAQRLEDLDVDYLLVNLNDLEGISSSIVTPLAVTIDLDIKKAAEAIDLGANVIILSEAITRKANVPEIVRKVKKAMLLKKTTPEALPEIPLGKDYVEGITQGLENVKSFLIKLEAQRRAEEEHKIQMEEEMARMEDRFRKMLDIERERIEGERDALRKQGDKIKDGWKKLKEAEIKWEEKQRKLEREHLEKQEGVLKELEEEREKRLSEERGIEECRDIEDKRLKIEGELGEVEREWKEIEDVWSKIDRDKGEIGEKRKEIEAEWGKIEEIKKELVKDQDLIKKQLAELEAVKRSGVSNLPKLVSRISEIKKKQLEELEKISEERKNIEERRKDVEAAEKRMEVEGERIREEIRKLEDELNKLRIIKQEGDITLREETPGDREINLPEDLQKPGKEKVVEVVADLQKLKEEHSKKKHRKKGDIDDENIKETINNLIDLVNEKSEIKLKEAAKKLHVNEYIVRRWGKLLEKRQIIEMKTPLLGDVILRKGRNMDKLARAHH